MTPTFRTAYTAACAASLAAVAVCMALWPGVRPWFVLPAMIAIGAATGYAYSKCPFRSRAGAWVLLAALTVTTIGVVVNVNYFTTVFSTTVDRPFLQNWDAANDWSRAVYYLTGENDGGFSANRYLSALATGLMMVFGRDITVPLMFNVLCYCFTLVCMGAIAWTLTTDRRTASATMIAGVLMCYLMEQATVFIKDVEVTLLMALAALVFARWSRPAGAHPSRHAAAEGVGMAAVLVAMMFMRAQYLYMIALGAVMFGIRLRPLRADGRFLAVAVAALALRGLVAYAFTAPTVAASLGLQFSRSFQFFDSNSMVWDNMVGLYSDKSLLERLLWLAPSTVLQFLLPFPWTWANHLEFGPFTALAHFGFFWYYTGALILYWLFTRLRKAPRALAIMVLWGVALTLITAYSDAGRASRYCLPLLPLLLPAAAQTALLDRRRRSLRVWLAVFTVILAATLAVCHHIHTAA